MTRALRLLPLLPLIAGVGLLSSCGKNEKKVTVTGAVSWKGNPIPEYGDIIFHPEDNASMPDAGKIVNGRYEVKTTPGKKIVQIFWAPEKPVPVGVMGQKEREQKIPAEYNHESTLRVEVTAADRSEFDFHLPLGK